ncbi:MAG: efflux RND transporter periplasmic adaptor subunit [Elusimicrobia bacterium]|nr:efflux RND transporter periplasmic adaptor subunit [Elusimicrobiota bacterium]
MTRRKIVWITGTVLLVGGGVLWWRSSRAPEGPSGAREVLVTRGDIELSVLTTGDVRPRNRLEIKPPIPGRAEEILVREGDVVRKGQILAWMSSTERAALLDAARAKGSAELARWEDLYKPTPLVAPLTGSIIARNMEPGQTVSGSDAVLVMSDRLILKAQVDETDMAQVRLGQEVGIVLDAFPGERLTGVVEHIAFEAKTVSNVTIYEVDVLPVRVPPFMRSGMTANLTFRVEKKTDVLLLPAAAVKTSDGVSSVALPSAKGKSETQSVLTGISNGKQVEILSELAEGDRVLVTDGLPAAAAKAKTSPLSPMMRRPRRAR